MPISRRNFLTDVAAVVAAPALPAVAAVKSSSVIFEEVFHPTITVKYDWGDIPNTPPVKKQWFHDMDISSMYTTPIVPMKFS